MKKNVEKKKFNSERLERIITVFVFTTLVMSAIYAAVNVFFVTPGMVPNEPHGKVKSDYVLMLLQCVIGISVMFLPGLLKKRWKISVPSFMHMMFALFLFAAIVLGEVRNFYYTIPHWDTVLHSFSGAMLGAIGFSVVDLFNTNENVSVHMSEKFVAIFAFCFALALGAVWEIYEFTGDSILGLNMQKFALEDRTMLVGQAALADTMKDIIVDALSALAMTIVGYFSLKERKRLERIKITRER